MSRKYTIDDIKEYFKGRGYTLLDNEYKDCKTKLNAICPNGHDYVTTFDSFKNQNSGCPICAGLSMPSYEEVKKTFEDKKFKLLSEKYINNTSLLEFVCPNGHIIKTSYNVFKKTPRCARCDGGWYIHTYQEVKEYFEKYGYELISDTYENMNSKLKYICPFGHISQITFGNFKSGHRCGRCAGKSKLSYEEIKLEFEKRGFIINQDFYIDNATPVKYICPNGHNGTIRYGNFQQGSGCMRCAIDNRSGEKSNFWNPNKKDIIDCVRIHDLSKPYMNAFKKKYNILDEYHVHHIIRIKTFVENKIYDLEIINDDTNLVGLSVDDHKLAHKIYPPQNNELKEYLKKFENKTI